MRGRALIGLLVLALGIGTAGTAGAAGYPWPIKPFNKQHPVRGNIGDPRTIFELAPSENGLNGPGSFTFHNGVDISCPPGTPVYPVMSGRARLWNGGTVIVTGHNQPTFHYAHIYPAVATGQKVVARRTVLGYVQTWAAHVHLTELWRGRIVNPLARGNLRPYRDRIQPTVREILVRDAAGQAISPLAVSGKIWLAAEAFDLSSIPVPGAWFRLPVVPAQVVWRLESVDGQPVIPDTVTADFRAGLPPQHEFWREYARGTYQNVPRFADQIFTSMPGRYLFNLTPEGLDTRVLPNGVYSVAVSAVDIRGNLDSLATRISVVN